jgi:hypothetical protein
MTANICKKEIIDMEVIMKEIASAKENVELTIQYWRTVLDELDRRAIEYAKIYKNMKKAEEEDKRKRDC